MDEFEDIYNKYYNKILYYLLSLCKNTKLAEDLTQEVFFKTLLFVANNKNTYICFSWFVKVSHNVFIDYIRKNSVELRISDQNPIPEIDLDLKIDVKNILDQLPTNYRILIVLKYKFNFTYSEIAKIMSCSESVIKASLFRARNKFKEVFQSYEKKST